MKKICTLHVVLVFNRTYCDCICILSSGGGHLLDEVDNRPLLSTCIGLVFGHIFSTTIVMAHDVSNAS